MSFVDETDPHPQLLPVPSGALTVGEPPPEPANGRQVAFSLVIPTYNESKNIAKLVELLASLLDAPLPGAYELIVVDDDSPDRTWEIASNLTAAYPQLRVLRRTAERGLSTAIVRGWQVARGNILGAIDADLQHPPETLLQLYEAIVQGADLAVASRHVDGGGVSDWSFLRRCLSRGAQVLGLIILPGVVGRVSDPMSGYFLVRRSCLQACPLSPLGYKILLEVIGRGRIGPIAEVGYVFQERLEGASKVTRKQYVDYLRHLLRLRCARWPVGRFLRFGIVGFSGVFVSLGVFFLLRDPRLLNLPLTRSSIIADELAIINNFLWNDLWTFSDISRQQKGWQLRLRRFAKFNAICLAGVVLNALVLNLLFNVFGINEYVAKLLAIAAVTLWNFWLNLKLSWRTTAPK